MTMIWNNIKLAISTIAISLGVGLLFISAGMVDGNISTTEEIAVISVLSLFLVIGGLLGLKFEGIFDK